MESRTFLAMLLIGVIGAIVVGWVVVLVHQRRKDAKVRENRFPGDEHKHG